MKKRLVLDQICFYCSVQLTKKPIAFGRAPPLTARTTDHIVPRSKINASHPDESSWHSLNSVQCCFGCNQMKADMWPLDWLEILPAGDGVDRLAARLVALGCPVADIAASRSRRTA